MTRRWFYLLLLFFGLLLLFAPPFAYHFGMRDGEWAARQECLQRMFSAQVENEHLKDENRQWREFSERLKGEIEDHVQTEMALWREEIKKMRRGKR